MKKITFLAIPVISFFIGIWGVTAENLPTDPKDFKYIIQVESVDASTGQLLKDGNIKYRLTSNDSSIGNIGDAYESKDGITKFPEVGTGKYSIELLRENLDEVPGYVAVNPVKTIQLDQLVLYPVNVQVYFTPRIWVFRTNAIGTKYQILDLHGSIVKTWVQKELNYEILKLPAGEYKLHVVSVPNGFQIPADQSFVIEGGAIRGEVNAHVLGTGLNKVEKEEKITNVPNTSNPHSTALYTIGFLIIVCGTGLFFKHCK